VGTDSANIADINSNMVKLDAIAGLNVCTSSTRPSSNLFIGCQIWETDTGKEYVCTQVSPSVVWTQVLNSVINNTYTGGNMIRGGQDTNKTPLPSSAVTGIAPFTIPSSADGLYTAFEVKITWGLPGNQNTTASTASVNLVVDGTSYQVILQQSFTAVSGQDGEGLYYSETTKVLQLPTTGTTKNVSLTFAATSYSYNCTAVAVSCTAIVSVG